MLINRNPHKFYSNTSPVSYEVEQYKEGLVCPKLRMVTHRGVYSRRGSLNVKARKGGIAGQATLFMLDDRGLILGVSSCSLLRYYILTHCETYPISYRIGIQSRNICGTLVTESDSRNPSSVKVYFWAKN